MATLFRILKSFYYPGCHAVFFPLKLSIARQDFCCNWLLYWKAVKESSYLEELKNFL